MKPNVLVITSTIRQNRMGRKVADWYISEASKAAPEVKFEHLDISELDLPFFNEPIDPLSAELSGKYTQQQKQLAKRIGTADGYVFVTGEYNHAVPGSLKNFLDYLAPGPWQHKAAAFVAYGSKGGYHAVNNLSFIMAYLGVMTILDTIHIDTIWSALDENGVPKPGHLKGNVKGQLDELLWWVDATKAARNKQK